MIAKLKQQKRGLKWVVFLFALIGMVAMTSGQPSGNSPSRQDLVGTWLLVGENGSVSNPPGALKRLKFITPTHWTITQSDEKTGVVVFHHGGTYTLKGNRYVETVEFANQNTASGIGRKAKYTIKLEGDLLKNDGIEGTPWKEVWKRQRVNDRVIDGAVEKAPKQR
ncbi:MAG: hypothetical protein JWO95_791 [Verrucomicrobiales bacterium]|nr:hypothetical protein [Verrucomicrobiales bacterium]